MLRVEKREGEGREGGKRERRGETGSGKKQDYRDHRDHKDHKDHRKRSAARESGRFFSCMSGGIWPG